VAPPDPDDQLRLLCQALNEAGVAYLVFGSHAARLHGAALDSDDVDLVPDAEGTNLVLLCDALNVLRPRWRVPGYPGGVKIDGGRLEPRHFQADSVAVGLVTAIGNIDIVLRPRGFEAGYPARSPRFGDDERWWGRGTRGRPRRPHLVEAAPASPKDLDQLPALEDLRDHVQSANAKLPHSGSSLLPDDSLPPIDPDHEPPGPDW